MADSQLRRPSRILVPVEHPDLTEPVLVKLAELAQHLMFEIELLHVWEPLPFTPPDSAFYDNRNLVLYREAAEQRAQQILDEVQRAAEQRGLRVTASLIEAGDVVALVGEIAERRSADWIALASHQRRGASRWFLGSVTEKIAASVDVPVLTVPTREPAA